MSPVPAVACLLRDLSLPYLLRHRLRACLTLIGVMIGTAVVVAIQLVDRSVVSSFAHTVETIAGSADLQVANASAGVPEELIARLAGAPGVDSAAGLVQGTLATPHGDLTVFGVDLFGDQRVREVQFPRERIHIEDELVFANAADSVAVSRAFLARIGGGLGASIDVIGPAGARRLVVRGEIDPVGPAALFDGAVAVADLPVAQALFGRPGRVDQIDVKLVPGADAATVALGLEPLLGGTGDLRRPAERASGLEAMLGNLQTFLTLTSLEAIVVGFFLVYHALRTAIAHRRREIAIARAIGYRRATLAAAIAVEAVAFGAVGAVLGAVLGVGGARLALDAVRSAVAAIYVRTGESDLALRPSDLLLAVGLGVATALLAAWGPAREAARLPVIRHLRTAVPEAESRRGSTAVALRGLGVAAAGVGLYLAEPRWESFTLRVALLAGAAALLAFGLAWTIPLFLRLALAPLLRLAGRSRDVSLGLAVGNVVRDAERHRGTIAALMVAFALVVVSSSLVASLRASILSWVDQTLAADLYVGPSPRLPLPSGDTFAEDLGPELEALPGVSAVAASRLAWVQLGEHPVVLRTLGAEAALGRMRYPVVATDGPGHAAEFASGAGVLVSDNLAHRERIAAGDRLTLRTPSGEQSFRVAAIVTDFTLDVGTVTVEEHTYRSLWGDRLVNVFYVWLEPGAAIDVARTAIRERLGGQRRLSVLTAGEFKRSVTDALDGALLLTYAIELVAVAIAVIAVANFFLVAVRDRRREVGLLRAVALGPGQLARMLHGEAAVIGLSGGCLALLYALIASFFMVTRSARLVSGWSLSFVFPLGLAAATLAIAALASVAAAALPVRGTVRRSVAELIGRQ